MYLYDVYTRICLKKNIAFISVTGVYPTSIHDTSFTSTNVYYIRLTLLVKPIIYQIDLIYKK